MWWKCIVDQDCLGRWYQISLKWTLLDSRGTASPHTPSVTNKHQFSVDKKNPDFWHLCTHSFHAFLVVCDFFLIFKSQFFPYTFSDFLVNFWQLWYLARSFWTKWRENWSYRKVRIWGSNFSLLAMASKAFLHVVSKGQEVSSRSPSPFKIQHFVLESSC